MRQQRYIWYKYIRRGVDEFDRKNVYGKIEKKVRENRELDHEQGEIHPK
jgi:hypothetical protein